MLTIRLTRKGKKNQPFFRVVVIDKRRSSKGGRAVEDLGYKNPLTKKVSINKDRAQYWIKNGAQPSDTIHNLFVKEGIMEGKKIHVAKISKKKQAELEKAAADAKTMAAKKAEDEAAAKKAAEEAKATAEAKPAAAPEAGASLAPEGAGSAKDEQPAPEAPKDEPKPEQPKA